MQVAKYHAEREILLETFAGNHLYESSGTIDHVTLDKSRPIAGSRNSEQATTTGLVFYD